ncbi:MAG: imidazole glycerol phosphate synthase subunit HisH [Phycisphaerae bacterium]|nr:imidazole glycerol phosphate synthase subunit HisH [Phycisphaerae bacterium]
MSKISIIDYGMGNLHSVVKALGRVGADAVIIDKAEDIIKADKIVLPGVGAFRDAIATLQEKDMVEPIKEVVASGKPFIGICLGFQMLFDVGYEDGCYDGLGIIGGTVEKFEFGDNPKNLKVPHMGWNSLKICGEQPLFKGIEDESFVYFVHSYYVKPSDDAVAATKTTHGIEFVSSIHKDNVYGVQFHPEKSQTVGMKILENFVGI